MSEFAPRHGRVYLVGAGPGDPGLLTLRGAEVLALADVVLYDYLVNPVVASRAPPTAELICLGVHGRTRIWSQAEVNARLVELAIAGKTVVRLKGGDPAVFGRLYEETAALAAHQIEYEIVPGVSAAIAAADAAEVPLTHRDHASAVAFVTGMERKDRSDSSLDYRALADFPGTLVFYMSVTSAERWAGQLIENGKPADTPVVLVRRASLPDQRTLRCSLGEVPERLTPYKRFPPPALAIVGGGAAAVAAQSWFESRPLFGYTVLVTRPAARQEPLSGMLRQLGAQVLEQPAIEIRARPFGTVAVDRFGEDNDWLLFTSANGVDFFFEQLRANGKDTRVLGRAKIGVVGSATAAALGRYFLQPDLVPQHASGQALAEELMSARSDGRVLWVRGSRVAMQLKQSLTAAGLEVEELVVYESDDVEQPAATVVQAVHAAEVDLVTVTSGAIAKSLAKMFGDQLKRVKLVSLSPSTSDAIREAGFQPLAEAAEPTNASLISALLDASSREQK